MMISLFRKFCKHFLKNNKQKEVLFIVFLFLTPSLSAVADDKLIFDIPCNNLENNDACNIVKYKINLEAVDKKDWDTLLKETTLISTAGLLTLIGLTQMPTSFTNWEEEDLQWSAIGEQWVEHVKNGPVWDQDDFFLNYVTHPYSGGIYYVTARHNNFSPGESFLYSAALSTFFWEYGLEAFFETPSIQDLIVTPVAGAALGELMYLGEKKLQANNYYLLDSKILGQLSSFFLNPIGKTYHQLFPSQEDTSFDAFVLPSYLNDTLWFHLHSSF